MDKIRKKIGFVFSIFSGAVLLLNIVGRIFIGKFDLRASDALFIPIVIAFLLSSFAPIKLGQWIQFITLVAVSLSCLLMGSIYISMLFLAITFFMGYIYHFFDEKRKEKLLIAGFIVFAFFQLYCLFYEKEFVLNSVQYTAVLCFFIYSIYSMTRFAIDEWLELDKMKIHDYQQKIEQLEKSTKEITKIALEAVELLKELNGRTGYELPFKKKDGE